MKSVRWVPICTLTLTLVISACSGGSAPVAPVDPKVALTDVLKMIDEDAANSPPPLLGAASRCSSIVPILDPFDDVSYMPQSDANQDWMAQRAALIGDRQLRELALPGSHDSGTYPIDGSSFIPAEIAAGNADAADYLLSFNVLRSDFKDFPASSITAALAKWARAQRHIMDVQLKAGVRYFDLRVIPSQTGLDFYTTHGLQGAKLGSLLKELRAFLKLHPKEIVVLNFQHLFSRTGKDGGMSADDLQTMYSLVTAYLDPKLVDRSLGPDPFAIALNDLWSNNRQVVVLFDDATVARLSDTMKRNVWSAKSATQYWGNTTSWWGDTGTLSYLNSAVGRVGTEFSVLQGQMTPTQEIILKRSGLAIVKGMFAALIACYSTYSDDFSKSVVTSSQKILDSINEHDLETMSLKEEAQDSNPQLTQWIQQHKPRNVVIADFIADYPDLIQAIIDSNM